MYFRSKKGSTVTNNPDNINYSNISCEGNRLHGHMQQPNLQEMLGNSFRNKRKSNQVIRKKRLIFDKNNNEHLSTADFLDGDMNFIKGIKSEF